MTDLDTMLAMLDRAKIEFDRSIVDLGCKHAGHTALSVERGYIGFVSQMFFNQAGALISVEAYE